MRIHRLGVFCLLCVSALRSYFASPKIMRQFALFLDILVIELIDRVGTGFEVKWRLIANSRHYFAGSGASTGMIGCTRKKVFKDRGNTPDHGGGVYPIGSPDTQPGTPPIITS
jgi:hypothetical protein